MRMQPSLAPVPDIRFKRRCTPVPAVATDSGHPLGRTPTRFDSDTLLRGTREVLIQHGGEVYRLRHTRNDKLILTK